MALVSDENQGHRKDLRLPLSQKKQPETLMSFANHGPVLLAALLAAAGLANAADDAKPLYRDAAQPIEKRVQDLLGRMTLEEKVGQMNMPCVYVGQLGRTIAQKTEGVQKFTAGTFVEGFGPGGGFFTLPNNILMDGTRQQAEFLNKLQRIALEQTRLGIPLLETEEGTHGLMCAGATIFPEGPSLGSTWNMDLLGRVYATVAKESTLLMPSIARMSLTRASGILAAWPEPTSWFIKRTTKSPLSVFSIQLWMSSTVSRMFVPRLMAVLTEI